jgi:hypothetical protein
MMVLGFFSVGQWWALIAWIAWFENSLGKEFVLIIALVDCFLQCDTQNISQ